MMDALVAMFLAAEQYALEHPEDPRSADFLYELHELQRRIRELD